MCVIVLVVTMASDPMNDMKASAGQESESHQQASTEVGQGSQAEMQRAIKAKFNEQADRFVEQVQRNNSGPQPSLMEKARFYFEMLK